MWKYVGNDKIDKILDINLQATYQNGTEFYYRQLLVCEGRNYNYTAITKVDAEFNKKWEKVYKTALDRHEEIVLDEQGYYFYTIMNIGDTHSSNDLIMKHNQTNGNIVKLMKLDTTGYYKLSNLQYDTRNHNISFLMTNNTHRFYQV